MKLKSAVAGVILCSLLLAAGCTCPCGSRKSYCKSVAVAPPQQKQVTVVADNTAYDKAAGTMLAEGNIKRTAENWSVITAEKAEITPAKK